MISLLFPTTFEIFWYSIELLPDDPILSGAVSNFASVGEKLFENADEILDVDSFDFGF